MTPAPPSAWILAGGAAIRYGSDKALARIGSETLLERTARICGECGLGVTVVARFAREGGLPTLIERNRPERHPLFGVSAALFAAAVLVGAALLAVVLVAAFFAGAFFAAAVVFLAGARPAPPGSGGGGGRICGSKALAGQPTKPRE